MTTYLSTEQDLLDEIAQLGREVQQYRVRQNSKLLLEQLGQNIAIYNNHNTELK